MFKTIKLLMGSKENSAPSVGKIDFGDFSRLEPFSRDWGINRGGPIDRYYIDGFLRKHSADIKGRALEVQNDNYLKLFGESKVTSRDVLDVDASNPCVTIVADLSKADQIESNTYDCFVLTQTLQLIYDVRLAMKHVYRILKPGGVLLLTLPGISHFPHKIPRQWSFTNHSVKNILEECFSSQNIEVETHGNVMVAAAFLYGVGAGELTKEQYDYNDPNYQLIITARAVK